MAMKGLLCTNELLRDQMSEQYLKYMYESKQEQMIFTWEQTILPYANIWKFCKYLTRFK